MNVPVVELPRKSVLYHFFRQKVYTRSKVDYKNCLSSMKDVQTVYSIEVGIQAIISDASSADQQHRYFVLKPNIITH